MQKRRALSLLLVSVLVMSCLLIGCQPGEGGGSGGEGQPNPDFVDKHTSGTPVFSYNVAIAGKTPADRPTAPGDVYAPGEASTSDKVILSGVTVQAGPDDSIIIEGAGFKADNAGQKVWVYAQTTDANGKKYEAQVTAADAAAATSVTSLSKTLPAIGGREI